jgi:hypothetical protein
MLLNDGVRDRQAEPRTLSDLLRREERIEDLRLQFLGYPGAVVVDLEHDGLLVGVVPRADDEDAAAVGGQHRLLRVDDEIEENLLQLMTVHEDVGEAGRERVDDLDVVDPQLVRAEGKRFAHDLVDVDHGFGRLALARKRQQVADDARSALAFRRNRLQPAANRFFKRRTLREAFGPAQDGRERVVELMSDAGHGLAECRHFFGLQQLVIEVARLIVEPLPFAHVADERFDAHAVIVGWRFGVRRELNPHRVAVGAP